MKNPAAGVGDRYDRYDVKGFCGWCYYGLGFGNRLDQLRCQLDNARTNQGGTCAAWRHFRSLSLGPELLTLTGHEKAADLATKLATFRADAEPR